MRGFLFVPARREASSGNCDLAKRQVTPPLSPSLRRSKVGGQAGDHPYAPMRTRSARRRLSPRTDAAQSAWLAPSLPRHMSGKCACRVWNHSTKAASVTI